MSMSQRLRTPTFHAFGSARWEEGYSRVSVASLSALPLHFGEEYYMFSMNAV